MTTRNMVWAVICYSAAGVGGVLAIFTASRSTVIPVILTLIPMVRGLLRKPIFTLFAIIVLLASIAWSIQLLDGQRLLLDRLGTLETYRYTQFQRYIEEIAGRPVFGLLFHSGQSFRMDVMLNYIPHNAYLHLLWLGGFSHFLPYLLMLVLTVVATVRVWNSRAWMAFDPLLLSMLASMVAVIYLHGLTSSLILTGNNILGFFHLFLSMLFLTLNRDLLDARARGYGGPA